MINNIPEFPNKSEQKKCRQHYNFQCGFFTFSESDGGGSCGLRETWATPRVEAGSQSSKWIVGPKDCGDVVNSTQIGGPSEEGAIATFKCPEKNMLLHRIKIPFLRKVKEKKS